MGVTHVTEPFEIPLAGTGEELDRTVELLRGVGHPRLVFSVEAEDKYELWRTLDHLNAELRAVPSGIEIPYPEGWGYEGGEPE